MRQRQPSAIEWSRAQHARRPLPESVPEDVQHVGRAARPCRGGSRAAPAAAPSWVDRPMRWAQLTLVEDDPGKFDPEFWLDYFRRTHCDAVCLSAGGCVAYYPTEVPFHHRSQWLGDRDPFGELVAGCRKLGMVVDRAHRPARDLRRRPARRIPTGSPSTPQGQPRRHWASPEMWVTCALGPVQLRVHDRGAPGDHDALPRRRHLHQPLGRLRHVLLRALPDELPGRDRPRSAADRRPAGSGAARVHRSGSSSASSSSGGSGTPRSARSTPTPASSPTPAAARPARST